MERSRTSIRALMDVRPDYANLVRDGGECIRVSPEEVSTGDLIMVRPGERVPLDGVIIDGETTMDTSALTGESMPRTFGAGGSGIGGDDQQKRCCNRQNLEALFGFVGGSHS